MSTPRSVRSPESPGKRPRNWEHGAARPRASCGCSFSSEDWGGDLGTTRVACLRSACPRHEKGGMSPADPPWTQTPLGAPQRQPNASTRAILLPQLRSPRRARTSSADPAPQPLTGKAEPRALSFSFVSRVTTTPSLGRRASGEGRHSLRHSHSPGIDQGSSPKPTGGGQLVAGRGFRLRVPDPELIPRRWPSSSFLSRTSWKSRASEDLRAGAAGPGAPGLRGSGESSWWRAGRSPGREQPR